MDALFAQQLRQRSWPEHFAINVITVHIQYTE